MSSLIPGNHSGGKMDDIHTAKTEKRCVYYPWTSYEKNGLKIKSFVGDRPDDNSKTQSNQPENTLTAIACGVLPDVTQGLIEDFCEKGVSMVMFDFHGLSYEQCRKMVKDIRQGVFDYSVHKNHRVPYSLALVLDLVGTRMTTGTVSNAEPGKCLIELSTHNHVYVTNDVEYKNKCTENRIYVSTDCVLRLNEHDRILLDYEKIELAVERVDAEEVYCVVKRGDFLGSEKVVNIAGISNGMKALTGQDEEDIRTGIRLKVDAIAIPGARNADFINDVKRFVCQENGKNVDLYAKVDNAAGFENVDEIIPNVDAVFLHRRSLSVEVGFDKIFLAQKTVLSKCNSLGKPIVTYGGFLSSMDYSAVPSCAEVNDVIAAVLDGTDCVYLDVTTRSTNKQHCVQYASFICRQAEAVLCARDDGPRDKTEDVNPSHAISIGCVGVSSRCHAAAIIVITSSGFSAQIIARYRPKCPVLAIVRNGKCARKLSVWRNITSVHYIDPVDPVWSRDLTNRTRFAMNFGMKRGILNPGDLVVHMSCSQQNSGFTNTMRLLYVSASDVVEA